MGEAKKVRGYGFSRDDLEAAWRELEKDIPRRGPACPETLLLLERALAGPAEALEESLKKHLGSCVYCSERFAAQRRVVVGEELTAQASKPPGATRAEISRSLLRWKAERRTGKIAWVQTVAGGGDVEERRGTVVLGAPPGTNKAPLYVQLHLTRPRHKDAAWGLSLYLPLKSAEQDGNAREDLEELASFKIALGLQDDQQTESWRFETRLNRLMPGWELVSHPQPVYGISDPRGVSSVEFVPLGKGGDYQG